MKAMMQTLATATTPVPQPLSYSNTPPSSRYSPEDTWDYDYDYDELWRAWAVGSRDVSKTGRVSCSSIESGSSLEEYVSEVDDNNNESNTATNTLLSSEEEDRNNNNVKQDEDLSNNKCKGGGVTSKSDAPGRTRLLDEDGFIRRAACVCVDETESKVLLVSSKKDPCAWLVPGGGVEDGEETPVAAIREAWEEAGVQGHISRYLGMFETQQAGGRKRHRTAVFVVVVKEVLTHYPEEHLGRRREWFSLEEGLTLLSRNRPLQSAYLRRLRPI